ncbi:MAG: hypothetical protein M1834_007014 [Cirrosporium novae-zelandiae]|nr:MAG: hypothetical protein M1834_007014 [Cirrosporium novae-zelandiae]
MSSNSISSKSTSTPQSPSAPQLTPSFGGAGTDNYSQRRVGSGSFGSASVSRSNLASARNNQSLRKQNKTSRRPKLVDEDAIAESMAMHSTNSRRGQTSITHLMRFSLPPRPQYQSSHRHTRRNPTWGLGSGYHAVDKARYVHANYRFIVNPKGSYHAQAVDADVHLDWNNVMQILASAKSQAASCPICLSTPVAPRMARCGHIFCLPCLIRYMHSTDEANPVPEKKPRWKKCPICWDSVYVSETRPVRWYIGEEGDPPKEGADVVLRLIMREPGSTLALPRDGADVLGQSEDIPWYMAAEVLDYARVMKGSEDYMLAQYDQEIGDMERQEREDELMFGEETQWTRKAISAVLEAKEKIKGIGNPPPTPKKPSERKSRKQPEPSTSAPISQGSDGKEDFDPSLAPDFVDQIMQPSPSGSPAIPPANNIPKTPKGSLVTTNSAHSEKQDQRAGTTHISAGNRFFFYQALLHYYLSPLDIRILRTAFGYYSEFPSTILPRVERVSTGHIVDDDLRKRCKYLGHLPYGCEVNFLECDWTDIVNPDILSQFKSDIDRRRKRNREKEMREEKDRARAEKEEEDKRWATARRNRPATTEDTRFSQEDFQPLATNDPSILSTSSSPPWPTSRIHSGSHFASLASPSTSPSTSRTVWGTRAITPQSPSLPAEVVPDPPDDGWLQNWEQDLLQEDMIARASDISLSEGVASSSTPGGHGKKKKGKKITLMSTNARRGA